MELFRKLADRRFKALSNRLPHTWDGKQIEGFLNGTPVLIRHQDGVMSPPQDLDRFMGLGGLVEEFVQRSPGNGCRKSGHRSSVRHYVLIVKLLPPNGGAEPRAADGGGPVGRRRPTCTARA